MPGGDTIGVSVPGGVPVAVAVFSILPLSMSFCVSVYSAVHVTDAFGPSAFAVSGHSTADNGPAPVNAPSFTPTFRSVTSPVLVILKLYLIV